MTTAILLLMFLGLLAHLLNGWGWVGVRALATHPPLGPYKPRWWWEEGILRFTKASWKALLVIQTLFLSALVAADLRDANGRALTAQWYEGMRASLTVVVLFLFLGLVGGASLQTWRISNEEGWTHGERSIWRCFAPTLPLGCLFIIGWTAILN